MRPALVLALAALSALALDAAAPPARRPAPPEDAHDVVYCHPARPYRVRLRIHLQGKPFTQGWGAVVRHLFDYLDVDGDGKLSRTELGRAPSADQWRQLT